jgi:hypothetical protein
LQTGDFSIIGVQVDSVSDEVELSFSYYEGDDPTPQNITVKAVKQRYAFVNP